MQQAGKLTVTHPGTPVVVEVALGAQVCCYAAVSCQLTAVCWCATTPSAALKPMPNTNTRLYGTAIKGEPHQLQPTRSYYYTHFPGTRTKAHMRVSAVLQVRSCSIEEACLMP